MKYLLTCIFLLAATSFLAAQTFHIQGNIELDKGELLVLTQQVEGMDTLAQTISVEENSRIFTMIIRKL